MYSVVGSVVNRSQPVGAVLLRLKPTQDCSKAHMLEHSFFVTPLDDVTSSLEVAAHRTGMVDVGWYLVNVTTLKPGSQ